MIYLKNQFRALVALKYVKQVGSCNMPIDFVFALFSEAQAREELVDKKVMIVGSESGFMGVCALMLDAKKVTFLGDRKKVKSIKENLKQFNQEKYEFQNFKKNFSMKAPIVTTFMNPVALANFEKSRSILEYAFHKTSKALYCFCPILFKDALLKVAKANDFKLKKTYKYEAPKLKLLSMGEKVCLVGLTGFYFKKEGGNCVCVCPTAKKVNKKKKTKKK